MVSAGFPSKQGPVEDQARRTIKKQIEQLVQLNEGQAFTYDRETLVKMLDEALGISVQSAVAVNVKGPRVCR